mgnify:FL=1
MSNYLVTTQQATGAEIRELVEELEEVIKRLDKPQSQVIAALLSLAIFYQNPEVTETELIDMVRLVSRYMAMVVVRTGDETAH